MQTSKKVRLIIMYAMCYMHVEINAIHQVFASHKFIYKKFACYLICMRRQFKVEIN